MLTDWNTGKLRYYTEPPEENDSTKAILSSEIVATFSEEFNLDSLDDDLKLVVEGWFAMLALYQEKEKIN